MTAARFVQITGRFPALRVAVVGDFFLDRYLIIDPALGETSIETGLPVHNVVAVRSQPGAAGTIVNNLVALGVGSIHAVGFAGDDGEGYELRRGLAGLGVNLDHFRTEPTRRTPVYCKPLIVEPGQPPRELNRLDSKNWTATPLDLQHALARSLVDLAARVDAIILLDQVDVPATGVITSPILKAAHQAIQAHPALILLADSRRGLDGATPLGLKLNATEFARRTGAAPTAGLAEIRAQVGNLARQHRQPVVVTLAERGIVGSLADGVTDHRPSLPTRGPIDVVGAGDAVTASLTMSLAAEADLGEALELAMATASLVVHQLGTTGTASVEQVRQVFEFDG